MNGVRLPLVGLQDWPKGINQSDTFKNLLAYALKRELPPDDAPQVGGSAVIRLPANQHAKLLDTAQRFGLELPKAFAALCSAALKHWSQEQEEMRAKEAAQAEAQKPPFEPKSPEQLRFFKNVMGALAEKRVVFAEASTGVGKGRAMVAAALMRVRAGDDPVFVAAPTVAVMCQLYEELRGLSDAKRVTYTLLPGASEFVDDVLLNEYIQAARQSEQDMPLDDAVLHWIKGGARALDPQSPLAQSIGPDAAWLMSDLRQLAPSMPVQDFALRSGPTQQACQAWPLLERVRKQASEDAQIVFCTHAMLAIMQKTQWRICGAPRILIVDEAHQLENAVANVNSRQISFYTLRVLLAGWKAKNDLGPNTIGAKALEAVRQLMIELQSQDLSGERINLCDAKAFSVSGRVRLGEKLGELHELISSKALRDLPMMEHYRDGLKAASSNLIDGVDNTLMRVDLEFSPDRRYPSLYTGPCNVDRELRDMWNRAAGGVVLASATLFITNADGDISCDYMRHVLAAPVARLSTPAPVIDASIYTLPTLYLPTPAAALQLIPPKDPTDESRLQWHQALAKRVTHIAQSAKGGTLVLLTAYIDLVAMAQMLRATIGEDRVIEQTAQAKFGHFLSQYTQAHRQGLRPVMLALGAAWTGVDFKDDSATDEQDTLLTDLVIARLPLALNRTNSMNQRFERMGMAPVNNEALLMFKQGLGRLIRRHGVKHRRLWVLDGRLHPGYPWKNMTGLQAAARRMLRPYKTQKTVD